jgi:AcrR family transcriptional regulator
MVRVMPEKGELNRQRIIEAANQLFYQRGFNQTSFSDVADAAKIPRGNFYYYFKSKDDILSAVVDYRIEMIKAQLAQWEQEFPEPRARLQRLITMLRNSAKDLARYGCPMGSLNIELGKAQPALKAKARKMFNLYRDWIAVQFKALGHPEPEAMALHILARAQGLAVLTQVYADTTFLNVELDQMQAWLEKVL